MKTFSIKLLRRYKIADETLALQFEKPKNFQFTAGQFVKITLIETEENDERSNSRSFSIASAPHEKQLLFVARIGTSAFKRQFTKLKTKDKIQISQPMGRFVLQENVSNPVVFLVGGIGITPVRSMILDTLKNKLQRPITVFCSNRSERRAVFINELNKLENSTFNLVSTITNGNGKKWSGENGRISKNLILKHIPNISEVKFYIVGPSEFVQSMNKTVKNLNVEQRNIHFEIFSGY